jgi:hypothetical protein
MKKHPVFLPQFNFEHGVSAYKGKPLNTPSILLWVMTMTDIDTIAIALKSMTAKQLQKLLVATPNREGSEYRLRRNAQTEAYFQRVKDEGLYPHNYDTFTQFREVLP